MSGIMIEIKKALVQLEEFVVATVGHRASSHSDIHMRKVFNVSKNIYVKIYGAAQLDHPRYLLVSTVAWLHDVPDHKFVKFDATLLLKTCDFLNVFTETYSFIFAGTPYEYLFTPKGIMSIIDRISFSKEKKNGDKDWELVLKQKGIEVRNIVSDADKLEAIGRQGLDRCAKFAEEMAEHSGEVCDRRYIITHVIEHYHEKLKILGTKYIRTQVGKELAKELDEEMKNEILQYNRELEEIS